MASSSFVWGRGGVAQVLPGLDRHLQAGEWLVLEGIRVGPGDGGSGPRTRPARPPAGCECSGPKSGQGWIAEVIDELEPAPGLVLADVDGSRPTQSPNWSTCWSRSGVDGRPRPWVVATVSPLSGGIGPELAALLACFPRTVDVPPLRRPSRT